MGKSSSKLSAESLERLESGIGDGGGPKLPMPASLSNPKAQQQTNERDPITKKPSSSNAHLIRGSSQDLHASNSSPFDAQLPNGIIGDEESFVRYLNDIFYREVEASDSIQTLFRGNCTASKIMSHCFRTFGSKYIKQLLEPHIKPLLQQQQFSLAEEADRTSDCKNVDSPSRSSRKLSAASSNETATNFERLIAQPNMQQDNDQSNDNISSLSQTPQSVISYEIDLTRLEEDGDIDVNQKNLLKLTKQILDSILSSSKDFPPQLNLMCNCLRQVICKKYPNSNTYLKAVGTVIFLRFINPAIVSPLEAGIVDEQLPPRTLRGLMLVSKILQNIANNVEFSKEEHMLPFNDFVRTQFDPLRQWVLEISTEPKKQAEM